MNGVHTEKQGLHVKAVGPDHSTRQLDQAAPEACRALDFSVVGAFLAHGDVGWIVWVTPKTTD